MSNSNNTENNSSTSDFSAYNKMHWMLGGEAYALRIAKEMFVKDLRRAQAEEKAACAHNHNEHGMCEAVFTRVCDLLAQCNNFYEVEALARFIFDDNYIPDYDGPEGIKQRGKVFRMLMPTWDVLRARPNARRSF